MPERIRPRWQFNYWQLLAFVVWGSLSTWVVMRSLNDLTWEVLVIPAGLWLIVTFVFLRALFGWMDEWRYGAIPPCPSEWLQYRLGQVLDHYVTKQVESDRGLWMLFVSVSKEGSVIRIERNFISYESRWLDRFYFLSAVR